MHLVKYILRKKLKIVFDLEETFKFTCLYNAATQLKEKKTQQNTFVHCLFQVPAN